MVLSARWATSRRDCLVCLEAIIAMIMRNAPMIPRAFDQPLNGAEARLRMSWGSVPMTIIHKMRLPETSAKDAVAMVKPASP